MNNILNFLSINFTNFYSELNEVGKLVFLIAILLFLILIVLVSIMLIQKSLADKQAKIMRQDEIKLEQIKKTNTVEEIDINCDNEKTKDLRNIVEELKKASAEKKDVTDIYEDEQEKTAIISYQELIKKANSEYTDQPIIRKIEASEFELIIQEKPKTQEIFSSVFTPNQEPIYKETKKDVNIAYNDSEVFLRSLKEFRNNL